MSSKLRLAVELIFITGVFYTNKGFKLTSAGLESFVTLKYVFRDNAFPYSAV